MQDFDFEGTLVLEQLSAAGMLDAFSAAVDADDVDAAARLMRLADVDARTIEHVLQQMRDV